MIQYSVSHDLKTVKGLDGLVVFFHEDAKLPKDLTKELEQHVDLSSLLKAPNIKGKKHEATVLYPTGSPLKRLILVGLGKQEDLDLLQFRHAAGSLVRLADKHGITSLGLVLPEDLPKNVPTTQIAQALGEGLVMGRYEFIAYKSKPESTPNTLKKLSVIHSKKGFDKAYFERGMTIAECVNIARNLANAPANEMTPKAVLEFAKAHFKTGPVKLSVIDQAKAKKLGMNLFLGVAQGSENEPYLLILTYAPVKGQKPIALVGKGVTFDTGGISIKPANKMSEMKGDMSGGAAVLGAMSALKELQPQRNVTAYIPLVENMPSGNAQRPGDIVKGYNGKTVEILNTDAEGRLILADALAYAVEQGVSEIMDIATLTGAALIALGTVASAIMSNSESMVEKLKSCATYTGDRVWQLPLYDDYLDLLKSDVADLSNCYEGRYGGTCSAGKFLEQFIGDTPWLHIDMAPVMINEKTSGHLVKGMSGSGVQNFVEYILQSV